MIRTTTHIINSAAECSVKQFILCSYENKYYCLYTGPYTTPEEVYNNVSKEALLEAFQNIVVEYLDASGLSESYELSLQARILALRIRIQKITSAIFIQHECIANFNFPFLPSFDLFEEFHHKLAFDISNPDIKDFEKQLNKVVTKESVYKVRLDQTIKELEDYRIKSTKNKSDENSDKARKNFIKMLNSLARNGFIIDKDKTTVEELALMISTSKEESKAYDFESSKNFNHAR